MFLPAAPPRPLRRAGAGPAVRAPRAASFSRPASGRSVPPVGPGRPGALTLSLLQQPASSVSGSGGAESQDRMQGGPAPRAAASSVADVHCTPPSGRSELFLPGTAGDFSLSASLSACTLLYEVPSRTGAGTSPPARRAAQGAQVPHSRLPAATAARSSRGTCPALRLRLLGRAGVEAARGLEEAAVRMVAGSA